MPDDAAIVLDIALACRRLRRFMQGVDEVQFRSDEGFARPWPDEIRMSPEVKAQIDALWKDLGL